MTTIYTRDFDNGHEEFEIDVEGFYQNPEPESWGHGGGNPGSPEEFDVEKVTRTDNGAELCLLDYELMSENVLETINENIY